MGGGSCPVVMYAIVCEHRLLECMCEFRLGAQIFPICGTKTYHWYPHEFLRSTDVLETGPTTLATRLQMSGKYMRGEGCGERTYTSKRRRLWVDSIWEMTREN